MASDWSTWPDDEQGEVLADKEIGMNIDDLIIATQGGKTDFREKMVAANGWQNYTITDWKASVEEADSASPSMTSLSNVNDLKPGMASKRTFLSAPTMGNRYPTSEMMRIISFTPGKECTYESCVITSAPYGDKFRVIVRSNLTAMNPTTTRFTAKFAIVYIGKINGMVKGMVVKGAKDGMIKSQANQDSIIKEFADIRPYGSTPTAAQAPPSPTPTAAVAAPPSAARGLLVSVFGADLVDALSPWASFVHALLAHLPIFKHGLSQDIILALFSCIALLSMLRVSLAFLRFLHSAGQHPTDFFAYFAYYLCKIIHVPYSMADILTTYTFVLTVKYTVNVLVSALPQPPSGGGGGLTGRTSSSSNRHARRPSLSVSHAADDTEASGVKYDGYRQAIASASMQVQRQQEQKRGRSSSRSQDDYKRGMDELNQRSEVALEQIRKGLTRVAAPFTPRDGGTSNRPVLNKLHQHQHRGRRRSKKHGKGSRSRSTSRSASVDPGSNTIGKGHHKSKNRSKGRAHSTDASPYGASPSRSGGVNHNHSPSNYASDTDNNAHQQPSSSRKTTSNDNHLINEGYCPPDLPSALRGKAVVEVIYENQRLQPFRGWGHSWPGHFLPTDKLLHWSLRDSLGEDIATSQNIDDVAPGLPPKWRWAEEGWHLDLSGVLTDSMDNQGWAYGLDFHYVTYPFTPGAGRKRMADFVRRRRWLRTRVPDIKVNEQHSLLETIFSGAILHVHHNDDDENNNDNGGDNGNTTTSTTTTQKDSTTNATTKGDDDGDDDNDEGIIEDLSHVIASLIHSSVDDNEKEDNNNKSSGGGGIEQRMADAMSQSILNTTTTNNNTANTTTTNNNSNTSKLQNRPSQLVIPTTDDDDDIDVVEVSLNVGTIDHQGSNNDDVEDGEEVEQKKKESPSSVSSDVTLQTTAIIQPHNKEDSS